ncbi:sulfur carrier protein ThiS [Thauera butanivorans]|mgnify:CR=1 FL=1|uniref:sulfur carrier protein ThiS n=1 Tax=Thauera butanivorans TaxID=86174 RepID=UPI003AB16370
MIQVIVNGQPEVLAPGFTVLGLLEARGLVGKRLAVERNGDIVPKARHAEVQLAEGDRVEIVVAVGGG